MERLLTISLLWIAIASVILGMGMLEELSKGHVNTVVQQLTEGSK